MANSRSNVTDRHRKPHHRGIITAFAVLAGSALLVACSDGQVAEQTTESSDWPVYESVDSLAGASTIVVSGTVGGTLGNFPIPDSPSYAYAVSSFQVDSLIAASEGAPASVQPGNSIPVGTFTAADGEREGQIAEDIGEHASGLTEGDQVVLFLAPFAFSEAQPDGWVPVGSDFGIFDQSGDRLTGRAPNGPLASTVVDLASLTTTATSRVGNAIERPANDTPTSVPEGGLAPTTTIPG